MADLFRKTLADPILFFIRLFGLKSSRSVLVRKALIYCHIQRRDLDVSAFPWKVKINTGYACNLRCPLCAVGRRESSPKHDLTLEAFRFFLVKLEPVKEIYLFGWGEPFLNKDIFEIIRLGKSHGKTILIDSNLNIADDGKLAEIVKSGLDVLSVSLDGTDQESYRKYRIGGDFALVIDNIKKLQRIKKELKTAKPVIQWQYIVNRKNQHNMKDAARMARELGVSIKFMPIGLYLDNFNPPDMKAAEVWLPFETPAILKGQNSAETPISDSGYCYLLYYFPMIDTDGAIYFCCPCAVAGRKNSWLEEGSRVSAGNLKESSFMEIFNNERYRHARSLFSNKACGGSPVACDFCRMYRNVSK